MSARGEPFDVVIVAQRAILPDGEHPCAIAAVGERIVAVESLPHRLVAQRTVELGDDVVVLPGLVDSHVHVCEPGNTDWEGFATATLAAAAGGITTLVDMPLDSIPTTIDVAALEVKSTAAEGQCHVDVGFWGGVVPGNLGEFASLREAGSARIQVLSRGLRMRSVPSGERGGDGAGTRGARRLGRSASGSRRERRGGRHAARGAQLPATTSTCGPGRAA